MGKKMKTIPPHVFENIGPYVFLNAQTATEPQFAQATAWVQDDVDQGSMLLCIQLPFTKFKFAVNEARHLLWLIVKNKENEKRIAELEHELSQAWASP